MNKDNYKKAIDQIKASDKLKRTTLEKMKQEKSSNKLVPFKRFLAACAVVAIVFSASAIYLDNNKKEKQKINKSQKPQTIAKEEKNDLPRFKSVEQLKEVLKENADTRRYFYDTEISATNSLDSVKESAKQEQTEDYSKTNTQVEGVDEADIVKTDGNYIYYVSNSKIYIVRAEDLKTISTIKIDKEKEQFYPEEIFIYENKIIILGTYNEYEENTTKETGKISADYIRINSKSMAKAIVYDITNKEKPIQAREVGIDGHYTESRMIDENVYFISTKGISYYDGIKENEILPTVKDTAVEDKERKIACTDIAYFEGSENTEYMLVAGFNINDTKEASVETFFGANSTVYSSKDNLYIAQTKYNYDGDYRNTTSTSTIYKFNLNNSEVKLQCKGEVKGNLNNQFSMDEYDGNLRIATTDGYDENAENQLYILDKDLNQIGKIENMAKGENIYSVRFMGKVGYIVTFEQVDPLFVIDLSDPTNPVVKGELKIPGYSSYLHPYDETHIIGIGYNTKSNEYGGVKNTNMKMSMFDVSDLENPKEMFNISIGGEYAYSSIGYNHKCVFYNKERNLIGFPLSTNTGNKYRDEFAIIKIDLENGFSIYGEIEEKANKYDRDIKRTIYIGEKLYTLTYSTISSYNINTLEKVSSIELEK